MKLKEFVQLLKETFNALLKSNVSIVAVLGVPLWLHAKVYIPYLREQMREDTVKEIKRELKDELKEEIIGEIVARNLSLELKLSEELNIPLYKVPLAIGRSVLITDSASKYYPLVKTVRELQNEKAVGLVLIDGKPKYRNIEGEITPLHMDELGAYRFTKDGKKAYIYHI